MFQQQIKLGFQFMKEEPSAASRELEKLSPAVAASLLEQVSPEVSAGVFRVMDPRYAAAQFEQLPDTELIAILQELSVADIAAMVRFCNPESRTSILALLPKRRQTLCQVLLSYPEHSIGALVETNVYMVDRHMKVSEVELRIKKHGQCESQRLYVLNKDRSLAGTLPLDELIRQSGANPVSGLKLSPLPTVSGLLSIEAAMALDCWDTVDTICVNNRKAEFVGILRHSTLRRVHKRVRPAQHRDTRIVHTISENYAFVFSALAGQVFESIRGKQQK